MAVTLVPGQSDRVDAWEMVVAPALTSIKEAEHGEVSRGRAPRNPHAPLPPRRRGRTATWLLTSSTHRPRCSEGGW